MADTQAEAVSTREVLTSLALPVYLPAFAINGGTAMLIPILPIYLLDLGLSYWMTTVVIAAAGLGGMFAQVPFGRLITKVGETKVMAFSVLAMAGAAALLGVTAAAIGLVVLRAIWGVGSVGWLLSRQTFLTRAVDPGVRGRAMSTFGGVTRAALLIGPLASGAIASQIGQSTAFAATGVVTASGLIPLLLWRSAGSRGSPPRKSSPTKVDLRPHRRTLAVAGVAQICVMAARQGRFVVLPFAGAEIGLAEVEIGALIAIGGFADLILFPVAGFVMDRFGRLASIGPAFGLLAIGLFVLALSPTEGGIVAAAVIMGIGNGIGSGSMLTVSSDLAPRESPGEFLGALGTIRDAGKVAGPLAVGVLADTVDVEASAVVLGLIALAAVAIFFFGVGETRDHEVDSVEKPLQPFPPRI